MIISIIIPVYNEIKTINILLQKVIEYEFLNFEIQKEIIVIDSNSTDGTSEILEKYFKENKIILIKEPAAMGKGHAVRNGLKLASGELILIQDADLEYEVNDYQKLIDPILNKEAYFVLGTRHKSINPFKMREMIESPFKAFVLNFGHLFLQSLFNILYNQKLTDIFTMYKVFHIDCIRDLEFFCDRFDFDAELVCKIILNGYNPKEISIKYKSRGFNEGKKVSFILDPPKILWSMIKIRIFK